MKTLMFGIEEVYHLRGITVDFCCIWTITNKYRTSFDCV